MNSVLLLARVVTAFVLVFAAAAKLLQDSTSFRQTVVDLGVPARLAGAVTVTLAPVELVIAVALLPSRTAWWGSVAAVGLFGAFTILIAMNLARGQRPACNCFGQISSEPIGARTLVRNSLLFFIALVPTLGGPMGAGPGVLFAARSAVGDADNAALWLTLVIGVAALQTIALLVLHGRTTGPSNNDDQAAPGEAGLPLGGVAPDFALPDRTGHLRRLADLLEPELPLLLLFTSPTCAPCVALVPELATWQEAFKGALRIVVLSQGAKADLPANVEVLTDEGGLVAQSYRYEGTPGAVLVAVNGTIASAVASGRERILKLISASFAAPGGESYEVPEIGDSAPPFVLPSTHGHSVSLADYVGRMVLLVFWDTSCGFCLQALPELRRLEEDAEQAQVHLAIVTTGSEEAVRAQGWRSHVLLDPSRQLMSRYGASGTPMALLLDAEGRVASDIAIGSEEVLQLGNRALHLAAIAQAVSK